MADEATLVEDLESAVSGQVDSPEVESTPEAPEVPEEVIDLLEAPEDWKAEHRDQFTGLGKGELAGKDAQEFALGLYKEFQGDYTRKTQSLAEQRRELEQIAQFGTQARQALSPFEDYIRGQGMDLLNAAAMALQNYLQFQQDPQAFVQQLAQSGVIDLDAISEQTGYVDPQYAQLKQQYSALENQIAQMQQGFQQQTTAQSEAETAKYMQTIQDFAEAKDENGEFLHPFVRTNSIHCSDVLTAMSQILIRDPSKQSDLSAVYQEAQWAIPELREKLIAKETNRKSEQAAAAAQKAQEASKTVKGKGSESTKGSGNSLTEDIQAAMDLQTA